MRPDDPNLPNLRAIAEAVGDLRDRVVFVGGATAGLLVTDPAAEIVRATKDVDAIVEAELADFIASRSSLLRVDSCTTSKAV